MLDKSRALILIPARNEAAHIGAVVAGCCRRDFTTWVLDDGSSDATAIIAREQGATVHTLHAQGKTAALRWALQQLPAEIDWVIFMDGDGQHQPSDLDEFWARAEQADLLIGNRWADVRQMPWLRRVVNWLMTRTVNFLSGGNAPDTQCGFRLVRHSAIAGWLPRGRHFEFETELYLHVLRGGGRIDSVPLRAVYGSEKSKIFWPRDAWRFFRCLARGQTRKGLSADFAD